MYSGVNGRYGMQGISSNNSSIRQEIRALEEKGCSASDIIESLKRSDSIGQANADNSFWGSSAWFYGTVLGVGCAAYILSRILIPEDNEIPSEVQPDEEWVQGSVDDAEVSSVPKRKTLDEVYSAIEQQSQRLEEAIALFTRNNSTLATSNDAKADVTEITTPPEMTCDHLLSTLQTTLTDFHTQHAATNSTLLSSAYTTLLMYLSKIREYPSTQRYQRVSPSSTSFKQLTTLEGHTSILTAMGFHLIDTTPNKHSLPVGANRVYEWQWGSILSKSDVPIVLDQAILLIQTMRSKLNAEGATPDHSLVTSVADTKVTQVLPEPPQAFKFDEIRRVASANRMTSSPSPTMAT